MIFRKEAEGEREHETIPYCATDEKHHCTEEEASANAFFLIGIKGWGDKLPYLVYDIREGQHQCEPEGGADMGHKLGGHIDVDDINVVTVIAKVRKQASSGGTERAKPLVEEEVRGGRGHDDVVKSPRHDAEAADHHDDYDDSNSEKSPT